MVDRRLRIASYVLAVVGLAAAGWLSYTKIFEDNVCGVSAGCTIVQTSPWSEVLGIPVSYLGVAGYVGILVALTVRGELARLALVVMTGIGFLFSMFLMYRAYITLEAFCPFCTVSAACQTLLFVVSATRFVRGPDRAPLLVDDGDDGDEDDGLDAGTPEPA